MTKFSFLMPAYKTAFLKDAIESILNQSLPDFELIISDDCSPDPVKGVYELFSSDPRVRYLCNSSNIGAEKLVSHWNILLREARGEYIIVAGDDDIYENNFLQNVNEVTEEYPLLDLIRARTRRINYQGKLLEEEKQQSNIFLGCKDFLYKQFSPDHIHCMGSFVFRKEALITRGGFVDFKLAWFSDDASSIMCSENGVVLTSAVSFNFRTSTANISELKNKSMTMMKCCSTQSFFKWYKGWLTHRFNYYDTRRLLLVAKKYCYHLLTFDASVMSLTFYELLKVMYTFSSIRIGLFWMKRKIAAIF